jgi:hypothetical protein
MAIDPQKMAGLMQRMQLAQGGDPQGAAPPADPQGGGMMAPQGGAPAPGGVMNSKISGTVMMAPAEGQQGGPPAPVQIDGTVRMSKSNAGGPPNMVRIEGDVMIAKPGGQDAGGQQGAPPGMAPQGMPPR